MGTTRNRISRLRTVGLVTAGLLAGAVIAGGMGVANAATSTPPPAASGSSGSSSSSSTTPPNGGGIGGAAAVRSDEKVVTGTDAETLKAAAITAVPGGTVVRVETDAGDAAYEVHRTKADGTVVTVKFDKSLAVVKVETGMGQGDPAPAGAPAGAPTGAPAPSDASSSTTTG
jgi:hypothetical protein